MLHQIHAARRKDRGGSAFIPKRMMLLYSSCHAYGNNEIFAPFLLIARLLSRYEYLGGRKLENCQDCPCCRLDNCRSISPSVRAGDRRIPYNLNRFMTSAVAD